MSSVATVPEGKKEACKTYIEQTKLLVTLASAFLFAPAGLIAILKDSTPLCLKGGGLTWFVIMEALFVCSVLAGYAVLGSLTGSQDNGSFDVFRKATRVLSLMQFGFYLLGISVFIVVSVQLIGANAKIEHKDISAQQEALQPFSLTLTLPPFESGSAEASEKLLSKIHSLADALVSAKTVSSIVLVGRADKRELKPEVRHKYASNWGLAQQRAVFVQQVLSNMMVPPGKILATTAGPLYTSDSTPPALLENDRAVSVYISGYGTAPLVGN